MNMSRLRELLGMTHEEPEKEKEQEPPLREPFLRAVQNEDRERDIEILEEQGPVAEKRLLKEVEKELQDAAEDSLKKLQFVQKGLCPACGEHLKQHLFASVCEACGWHTYETPRSSPVKVHLKGRESPIEGDRCYALRSGDLLVIRHDVVVARVHHDSVSWVEYLWTDEEIDQRHRQVAEKMIIPCGWCNKPANPDADGFHMVHIAFGATQERYCFCADECYEAFRKLYPARVHRNCYETNCSECNLCVKRYVDEAEGIRLIAKDYLRMSKR